MIETDPDAIQHAILLGERQCRGLRNLLSGFVAAEAQFSGSHNGLVDEQALHFAGSSTGANAFAGVTNRWVRIEASLLRATLCSFDVRACLQQRRVLLQRQLFERRQIQNWGGGSAALAGHESEIMSAR